jgi:tRNA-modifying protein YgfZ
VSAVRRIDLGFPALLEFRGPDAVRYLNGQLTQDVRRVAGAEVSLPSCVTDAKGRLQFRVWISGTSDGAIRVEGPPESAEAIEARLTRYLIADDVEVSNLTGNWSLAHFTGPVREAPDGVLVRESARFGIPGAEWWVPAGNDIAFPEDIPLLEGDELEAFRIARGVPVWGRELSEGILPPEAGLDATDISYQKGCYIGQEVISRIKSVGRVNRKLEKLSFDSSLPVDGLALPAETGVLTSVSPIPDDARRFALGYVKRGVSDVFIVTRDGSRHPASRDV